MATLRIVRMQIHKTGRQTLLNVGTRTKNLPYLGIFALCRTIVFDLDFIVISL